MTPGGTEIYLGRLRRLGQRGTDSVKSAWLDTRTYQPVAFSVLGILILALTIGPLIAQNASPFDETQDRKEEINDLVRRRAQWYFQQRRSAQGHVPGSLRLQALAENEANQHGRHFRGSCFDERFRDRTEYEQLDFARPCAHSQHAFLRKCFRTRDRGRFRPV